MTKREEFPLDFKFSDEAEDRIFENTDPSRASINKEPVQSKPVHDENIETERVVTTEHVDHAG